MGVELLERVVVVDAAEEAEALFFVEEM